MILDFEAIIDTKLNHDLDRVDNKSSTAIPTLVKINNLADSLSKKIRHANHLSNLIIDSLNELYKAEKLRSEASVESSRQQTMIVILIVTLTLVTTIYLSYQSIQKPISKLIDGVNRVATGDKHVTIEITGNNEYSKLATSFNHMVKEIENQKEELESQEKARQALNTQIQISEAANTHKEQLLSNISHEFRTPLNAILGFTEQISHDQSLSPINEHYLELITQSGNRLSNILEDILLISQSQLEIFDTSNNNFNLTDIIEEIIRTADYYLKDKPILITHDFSSDDGLFFRGDKNKIKHLFNNIILNAAKFTDQGKIAISLLKLNPCTINITDTGPGMSQEDIQDLLEYFTQRDFSDTRIHGGLGLGLAVSRTIIKNLKGKLYIAPAEPVGLSVTVELPLEISDKDSLENNSTENTATTTTEIEDKTILVAEDNLVNQKLMRTFLQELKLKFDICNNGKEAVDAFIRKKYDLVLMDIQMPIMDGIEATKRIRSLDNGQVPIITVTATSEYTSIEKCQSVGIDDCLPKPVRLNDIRTRLNNWLSQGSKQTTA